MTGQQEALSRRALLALLLLFAAVWLGSLDYRKLVHPDEGRYAEIAREMLVSGDWLTPRLDGLKYFEKPPLQYWATAASFAAFGLRDWAARLWPAATGLLCVLLVHFTGSRLFGRRAGLFAAAVLASSLLFLLIAHINTLDMGLCLFLQAGVSGFLLAQREPDRARRYMLLTWAALALAALSKGLVSLVLPAGSLVIYTLAMRDFSVWRRLYLGQGLLLFLLIAAPWHIAISLADADFFHFYFIHEHFERFLTKAHKRYQPWWYFLPILAAGTLPWTLMLLHAVARVWRQATAAPALRFLLIWSALVLAFFSVSGSKLPSYILPMWPALALVAGDFLARIERRTLLRHLALVAALALVALGLAALLVPRLAKDAAQAEPMAAYAHWLAAAAAIWLVGAFAACWLAWRRRATPALLGLAGAALLAGTVSLLGHEVFAHSNSSYYLAQRLPATAAAPFYSLRMYDQTLPFYLGRTLTLVDFRDELDFGLAREPDKGVPTIAEFKQRWSEGGSAYALMEDPTYDQLQKDGLPMNIIARDARRIVVSKP